MVRLQVINKRQTINYWKIINLYRHGYLKHWWSNILNQFSRKIIVTNWFWKKFIVIELKLSIRLDTLNCLRLLRTYGFSVFLPFTDSQTFKETSAQWLDYNRHRTKFTACIQLVLCILTSKFVHFMLFDD